MAFSLSEVMVAMTLLLIALGGAVASHLFGLGIMEKPSAKVGASAEARRNLSTLMSEVCSSQNAVVGNGTRNSFSEAGLDAPQKGTALQIYPSSDTNSFIRYFLDTAAKTLNRVTNGASAAAVVASGISNSDLFTAEDFAGNVVSNNQNNCAIGLTLQFSQVQNANWPVGPNAFYTSYQVRTKIARRVF
jgi:hypothetical protein